MGCGQSAHLVWVPMWPGHCQDTFFRASRVMPKTREQLYVLGKQGLCPWFTPTDLRLSHCSASNYPHRYWRVRLADGDRRAPRKMKSVLGGAASPVAAGSWWSSKALAQPGGDEFRLNARRTPAASHLECSVQDSSFGRTKRQHPACRQGGKRVSLLTALFVPCSACPQTVPEELQNGGGFGYVVAFRPFGTVSWMQTVVASPDAARYVFRNETLPPFSPYEVKVGVYNNKGEGSFSPVTVVYSAEEGRARSRNTHTHTLPSLPPPRRRTQGVGWV